MFANLTQLIAGQPPPAVARHAFVADIHVRSAVPRDPRAERLICWCWLLIAAKHIMILWAVWHYHVPIHPLWVNFPTWLLGVLATGIYYGRTRRA